MLKYSKEGKMRLIEKLTEYRLKHKLSQTELGKLLDVHLTTICRWERSVKFPNKIQTYNIETFLKKHSK